MWKNIITSCGYNGLVIQGEQCDPDVRGNVIKANRKAGIKLTEDAIAHIGGTEKADIKFIPTGRMNEMSQNNTFMTAKKEAIRTFAGSGNESMISMKEATSSLVNQTDDLSKLNYDEIHVTAHYHVKSFANANVI